VDGLKETIILQPIALLPGKISEVMAFFDAGTLLKTRPGASEREALFLVGQPAPGERIPIQPARRHQRVEGNQTGIAGMDRAGLIR